MLFRSVVVGELGEEPGDERGLKVGADQVGELGGDLVCRGARASVGVGGRWRGELRTGGLAVPEHDEAVLAVGECRVSTVYSN